MKNVVVGLSGGVDSAVTAFLLKKEGYKIFSITLLLTGSKMEEKRVEIARKVSELLEISHKVLDVREEFKNYVINYFCTQYLDGKTPNPCIVCNQLIKFPFFLQEAERVGAEFIATGHYAIVEEGRIKKGKKRDQSYFLYKIGKEVLKRLILPLGVFSKEDVLNIARDAFFPLNFTHSKDICFLDGGGYTSFLMERCNIEEGVIKDKEGRVLGLHKGLPFYTIGQRKGLGISTSIPLYVIEKKAKENALIVGEKKDCLKTTLSIFDYNFFIPPSLPLKVALRYRGEEHDVEEIKEEGGRMFLKLSSPAFAPAPGQSAVFYKEDTLVGGGIIG